MGRVKRDPCARRPDAQDTTLFTRPPWTKEKCAQPVRALDRYRLGRYLPSSAAGADDAGIGRFGCAAMASTTARSSSSCFASAQTGRAIKPSVPHRPLRKDRRHHIRPTVTNWYGATRKLCDAARHELLEAHLANSMDVLCCKAGVC